MKQIYEQDRGFGLIEILIAIVVILVLGFVGWKVYDASKNKQATPAAQQSSNSQSANQESNTYAGWKTYVSTRAGYNIKYPSDWLVKTSDGDYETTLITGPENFEIRLDSFAKDSKYGANNLTANPTGMCGAACLESNTLKNFEAPRYGELRISADKKGAGGGSAYVLDLVAPSGSLYIVSPTKPSTTTTITGNFQGWTEDQQTRQTMEQFTANSSVKTAVQILESFAY